MLNKKLLNLLCVTTLIALLILISLVAGINIYINDSTHDSIYHQLDQLPHKQTALVLGALVHKDGSLSDILKDRADTAYELYQAKKVDKILISGDHGKKNYDEVNAVRKYLLAKGVRSEDLFLDHAGFDTYDSLYRAKSIFQTESLIIVSQDFHLPRALFLAEGLGLDAIAIPADKHVYAFTTRNKIREILAKVKAFGDVTFHNQPKFLGPAIPITGNSQASWDEK